MATTTSVSRKVIRGTKTGEKTANVYAKLLQEYRDVSALVDPLVKRKAAIEAEIFALMTGAQCTHAEFENVVADITQSKGRTTNTIDPAKFRTLAKDDKVFYSCVYVVATKAKAFFADAELKAITDSKEGELGEKKLSIKIN